MLTRAEQCLTSFLQYARTCMPRSQRFQMQLTAQVQGLEDCYATNEQPCVGSSRLQPLTFEDAFLRAPFSVYTNLVMVDAVLKRFSTICHDSARPVNKASGFLRCSLISSRSFATRPTLSWERLLWAWSFPCTIRLTERTTICCSRDDLNFLYSIFSFNDDGADCAMSSFLTSGPLKWSCLTDDL